MLEIQKLTKIYETGSFKQKALDNVSLNFRKNEFAAILGPSGSGKTTFLNIIGGLDKYTSGDLIINEISTKKFKDYDWDSYRNHRIGFVFQNYNLISHQSIISNVLLALTLSGISKKDAISKVKKVLKDVGLEKHMYKKPNELSGGQMQRVAIARALVNDPDILLADEPTGALDSETSIQIMEILKKVSKTKLIIMVTHNPELAKKYSTRIITLKDGKITSDSNPYDGKVNTKEDNNIQKIKTKKTTMKFKTALALSFNNLMTKKGRTTLVSLAGSIGIIGISLIMALSTGFQNYIDSIQEEALTSYPLTINEESSDIAGTLLSLRSETENNSNNRNEVKEEQYISTMLSNISTNDLKSFKRYLNDNYSKVSNDISTIKYSYTIDPMIYTIDATNNLAKLNPSNLFTSIYGSNSMFSSYSSMASIYSQMMDNEDILNEQYNILSGRWPKEFNEMVIVLSEPNSISDLLVYSLGLRDTKELKTMISKVMSGEALTIKNKPLTITYDELLNLDLRLIKATDIYKYNNKYDIYEDMSEDKKYMQNLYDNALKLKIVGIVSSKEGTNSMALSPGVAYKKELIEYIIDNAYESKIVKKQLDNEDIDVFSGNDFANKNSNFKLSFNDLIQIDTNKLQSAFNINLDKKTLEDDTKNYMQEITNALTVDTNNAKKDFNNVFDKLITNIINNLDEFSLNEIDNIVNNFLVNNSDLKELERIYIIPVDTFKSVYEGLLKGFLNTYVTSYNTIDNSLTKDINNPVAKVNDNIINSVKNSYKENMVVMGTIEKFSQIMTEAKMKKIVLTKVSELTANLTGKIASSFKVDQNKIASAFKFNLNEEEMKRIFEATMSNNESSAKNNLLLLGYQDKESPTRISFYFNSFDGKENFMNFIDNYNGKVEEDKVIHYSDTTGILMSSVKTIVNAVSYVLIAFVSISLVVSSIMIGIITYISVYERTKEIGILRSIGASKRNISSIFNAETFIIGLLSGLFGIGITYLLIPIINSIIHHYTGNIPLNAYLNITSAISLIVLSVILTLISGLIPASRASKKDPVVALRTD